MAVRKPKVRGWPEVMYINDYAAFMGFLAMTIRGLGFLVVTWTTVVLLGGSVSLLQKKDFWCLTIITLIQIAGVIDNFGSGEKWGSVGPSALGLRAVYFVSTRNRLVSTTPSGNFVRVVVLVKQLLGWIAWFVQAAVYYVVVLCSGFSIVVWGPYICTGVSLWRLKERDYGNADGESSKSNMNPALDVLYIIVVVQCAILVYRRILKALVKKTAVAEVSKIYGFDGPSVTFIQDYMKDTLKGCGKNPSFAKERNLVTYAVDLMALPQDYAPGIIILSTILGPLESVGSTKHASQCWLIRKLVLYAPSCQTFRFLLFISSPRNNRYGVKIPRATRNIGSREVRKHAANIVLHMADGASPELLPEVIQCISSLIGTFEEHQLFFSSNSTDNESDYAKAEKDYLKRLWEGLHVLFVLADDKNNCNLIVNTPGLLTKIMTPLASNLCHQTEHDAWGGVVLESLKVIYRLTLGHGETLLRQSIINQEAGKNILRILRCNQCSQQMHNLARVVAVNLRMQCVKLRVPNHTREELIEILADIYTYHNVNLSRISALEALEELCSQDGGNAAIILQVNGSAVYSFTAVLDAISNGYNRYHRIVSEILQRACLHYTRNDEGLRILKECMIYLIPKVLKKILTVEATPTVQQGSALQNNGQNSNSSSLQEIQKQKNIQTVETALLSLCVTVHEAFISADQDLAVQFDDALGEFSLPVKLREMVERNSDATPSCLKILKLTSRMAVSMMKCRGSRYRKPDLESLVEALSKACSRKMYFIDSSMDFARGDDAAKTMKPERTFASFVTEAMDLVRDYRA